MRNTVKFATTALSLAAMVAGTSMLPSVAGAASDETIKMGKKVAVDRKKGNCLACHMMGDGVSPGDIGPPLIAMKARFPDRAKLRAQIWDATAANPTSSMIPFGRHKVLSEKDIDNIVEFLYTI